MCMNHEYRWFPFTAWKNVYLAKTPQTTQQAMENAIVGITLTDRLSNKDMRRKTQVTCVFRGVAQLK